jgi:hypothetical protein
MDRTAERPDAAGAELRQVFVTAPDVPLGWWEYYTWVHGRSRRRPCI